jgi:hypothetical protein
MIAPIRFLSGLLRLRLPRNDVLRLMVTVSVTLKRFLVSVQLIRSFSADPDWNCPNVAQEHRI